MTSAHVSQKRAERTDEILDVAARLIVGAGLESLTLQRLAGELGLATTALYRYFPGKTELMVALQVRAIEALAREIEAELAEHAGEPAEALAQIWRALEVFLDEPERAPARYGLIDAFLSAPEAQLDVGALANVEKALGPLLAQVAGAIDRAAKVGGLAPGDAEVRTRLAWASIHGLHHLRRRDRIEPRARQVAALGRSMIQTLFAGWGAPPDAMDAARKLVRRRPKRM